MRNMKYELLLWLLAALLICGGGQAWAAGPTETLKEPIEEVMALLKDPKYKDPGTKEAQREEIRKITYDIFDFTEISARALSRNWRLFTPQEKQEFRDVFAELLSNTYIGKIQSEYQDEKVVFTGELVDEANGKATVSSEIVRESVSVPVQYSLSNRTGAWRIYDVIVEGVSLVKNYRSQFDEILMQSKPRDLIQRLKDKVAETSDGKEKNAASTGS